MAIHDSEYYGPKTNDIHARRRLSVVQPDSEFNEDNIQKHGKGDGGRFERFGAGSAGLLNVSDTNDHVLRVTNKTYK
jgi:hypothetical protein